MSDQIKIICIFGALSAGLFGLAVFAETAPVDVGISCSRACTGPVKTCEITNGQLTKVECKP